MSDGVHALDPTSKRLKGGCINCGRPSDFEHVLGELRVLSCSSEPCMEAASKFLEEEVGLSTGLEDLWAGTEVEKDLTIIEVPPEADILDFIQSQKEDLPTDL